MTVTHVHRLRRCDLFVADPSDVMLLDDDAGLPLSARHAHVVSTSERWTSIPGVTPPAKHAFAEGSFACYYVQFDVFNVTDNYGSRTVERPVEATRSPMYFNGGQAMTVADVVSATKEARSIVRQTYQTLRRYMIYRGWTRVVMLDPKFLRGMRFYEFQEHDEIVPVLEPATV